MTSNVDLHRYETGMDFAKVRLVHARALHHLDELKIAKTFAEYEEVYERLLHDIQLIWNKTRNVLKLHPRKSALLKKYWQEREQDELLAYVIAARNSQEHTIAEVNRHEPASVLVATEDGRVLHLSPNPRFVGAPVIAIAAMPARAVPLPVEDQRARKVYPLPTTHLGQVIQTRPVEDWMDLCLRYYGDMLTDLEQKA
jgi:hypothetical protein